MHRLRSFVFPALLAVLIIEGCGTEASLSTANASLAAHSSSGSAASPVGLQFVPVTPCRVADTRNASGAFGGPELSAGSSREFDIPQSGCGIPASAAAYSLNVTVIPAKSLNYLTLWPSGQAQPFVSTLNSDGRVKANAAITPAGANGGVSVFASDATQVILDIDGYFVSAETASSLAFYPIVPCRLADTRNAAGPLGGPYITGGKSRDLPVQSSSCGIPPYAQAYSLNVTAIPQKKLNYLTAWPSGQAQPNVSTLNSSTGAVTANAAIVPAGSGGDISIFVSDSADVILDVNGFFGPPTPSALSLYTITPCRVVDTRNSFGTFNGVYDIGVQSSACAPPGSAQAYVLNTTIVPPGPVNYLTLWPDGETQPYVSTLNADDAAITSNMAIVPTIDGSVDAFASSPTSLILDLSSYFGPPQPVITGVSIANVVAVPNACSQLQVTITGTNLSPSGTIQANGTTLPNSYYYSTATGVVGVLPAGFVSKPGALSFTVTNPGYPTAVSAPFAYPATSPTVLGICPIPSPATVYDASSFTVMVQPTEVNSTGTETLSLGTLPSGITTTPSSVPLPPSGASLHFKAAQSAPAGTYNIALNGSAGTATATGTLTLAVTAGPPPPFYFLQPLSIEVGAPIGGTGSIQYYTSVNSSSQVVYDVTPSVSGLPAGTTASFSPSVFTPGQNVTVTITASAKAPVTQNASVTLTGTPVAPVAATSASFLVDVTQPPGSLPDNRTDFTSTAGTPYAAAYDRVHDLIFSSNPAWNRVDVLSNKTHQIVKSIPVLQPQGLDINPNNSTVWVGTGSQNLYAIDTTHLTATRYVLPQYQGQSWVDYKVEALSDGTVLLSLGPGQYDGIENVAVWNPANNMLTPLSVPSDAGAGTSWGVLFRSGDGSKVYSLNGNSSNCSVVLYDVASKTITAPGLFNEVCGFYAANEDGSRLVAQNSGTVALYDGSFNLVGNIIPSSVDGYFVDGTFIFNQDGSTLYELANGRITSIDTASLKVVGMAPAVLTLPIFVSETPIASIPIAIDSNGMLLGIQDFGIAFEDTAFFQNYGKNMMTVQLPISLSPDSGPLKGGTQTSPFGSFNLTPDVWFAGTRAASVLSQDDLIITSPPSSVAGPVNLKYLFPDGEQIFTPQTFSYSAYPQYAFYSGATPDGGVPGRITGYGMPTDASDGTLKVGGSSAVITTTAGQQPPYTGEPFPSTNFDFTVPGGSPGRADITVTSPAGTGTLPKAMLYAKSVTDYSSADTFTSLLFDAKRSQVYLTAGDHVDVFSTKTNQFVSTLHPAAAGKSKLFSGLALTPDGSQLLVTDLQDGSLAVINPDAPSSTFSIPIAPESVPYNTCEVGPLYVAATSNQQAFVTTGSLPVTSCPTQGLLYIANLQTKTATQPSYPQCGYSNSGEPFSNASSVAASSDGSIVVIDGGTYGGSCIYSIKAGTNTAIAFAGTSLEIAGDANILAADSALADGTGMRLGSLAKPQALYPSGGVYTSATIPLQRPRLNAAGSLYYVAYPGYFEIIDVLHGRLLVRFALNETIQTTGSPIAIDSGGRFVYLITDKGLTVVDLGSAPLAIGHLSEPLASAGTQITVRGSGFDSVTQAAVGGRPANVIFIDENTLTLTIPSVTSGPNDIVLTKSDGESYTLENGIFVH